MSREKEIEDEEINPVLQMATTIVGVKVVQSEIEESANYKQLVQQLNVVKIDGVMRCKGRLQFAGLLFEVQNPALLPRGHHYTNLVVKEAHELVLHGLVSMTLAEVRQRYWIPKGRQVVKKVLKECKQCAKRSSKLLKGTVTAPLPELRVKPAHPFEVTGCDFAGLIHLKGNEKAYIALFTCVVTQAVHLELTKEKDSY